MAGKVKALIDELLEMRAKGNPALVPFVRAHLILQGIDPDRYTSQSADNPGLERKLTRMLEEFGRS